MNEPDPPPLPSDITILSARTRKPPSGTRLHHIIKYLMVGSTVLWLTGMLFGIAISYSISEFSDRVKHGDDQTVLLNGRPVQRSEMQTANMVYAAITGIGCTTFVYAIAMVVLGVTYFASKPEKPS